MKRIFRQGVGRNWIGVLGCLVLGATPFQVFGQTAQPTQSIQQASPTSAPQQTPQSAAAAGQAFQQEQQPLAQGEDALLAKGVTVQDLIAWDQQNAATFQDLANKAKDLSSSPTTQMLPVATGTQMPAANATQELKDFATTHADIINKFIQFHNQRVQAGTASSKPGDEWNLFARQNAAELGTLSQQGTVLSQQIAAQPLPVPGPTQLPPDANPDMKAFALAQDQVAREEIALLNQYRTADAPTRAAALQQWRQANAARLQQVQQLAQKLSSPSSSTPLEANP